MIALKHERTEWLFRAAQRGRGRALDLDILVNDFAVVDDFHEARVGGFLALVVEPWGLKRDIEGLPLPGRLAGIEAWLGGVVDAAAIAVVQVLVRLAKAIEDLHLVLPLEIDAGIAPLGNVELDVQLAIAVLNLG